MAVSMFGYLISISTDFYDFISPFFPIVLVSTEKIYQTVKTVFDHISKHLEASQNTPLRVIFLTLFSVFGNVVMIYCFEGRVVTALNFDQECGFVVT